MKSTTLLTAIAMNLAATTGAFAADTHKVYASGVLVLVFIGFVALVVMVQMIPAIISLVGILRSLVSNGKAAEVTAKNN